MSPEKCPACGRRFVLRELVQSRHWRFHCPDCGAGLRVDTRRQLLAAVIQAPILAFPISRALHDPVALAFVTVALAVGFLVQFGFMKLRLWPDAQTVSHPSRPA